MASQDEFLQNYELSVGTYLSEAGNIKRLAGTTLPSDPP